MRQINQTLLIFLCISAIVFPFNGCKKVDSGRTFPGGPSLTQQVNTYLEAQRSAAAPQISQRILSLEQHLNYSQIRTEDFRNNEHFIVIPIQSGLGTVAQIKNSVNSLVLIVDPAGKVRRSMIAQYVPKSGQPVNGIAGNTISNIYNFKRVDGDGQYRFLTIAGRYLYEFDYDKGVMNTYKVMKGVPQKKKAEDDDDATCIIWYIIITNFYPDGPSDITVLLGTICDAGCMLDPTDFSTVLCEGGGGDYTPPPPTADTAGSGASNHNPPPALIPQTVQATWTITDPTIGYTIVSTESFTGVTSFGIFGGGLFLSVAHVGSTLTVPGPYTNWTEDPSLTYDTISSDGLSAVSLVGGSLTTPAGRLMLTNSINPSNVFPFNQIFP